MSETAPWLQYGWVEHTQVLLDSYRRWLGRDLIPRSGGAQAEAQRLFEAPFVVVSHGTQTDPVLNYGNRVALQLWEMDPETLRQTPSRLTAEPMQRDERARLLDRTRQAGYADDYSGVRISRNRRRFRIEAAVLWNLVIDGQLYGQAATFARWRFLDEPRASVEPKIPIIDAPPC